MIKLYKGKKFWASRNLGISSNKINLVRRVQKQQFADKNSILIDDYPKNVNEFRAEVVKVLFIMATLQELQTSKKTNIK